jgi:hypothetical protein
MGFDSDTFKFGNHLYSPSLAKMGRRGDRKLKKSRESEQWGSITTPIKKIPSPSSKFEQRIKRRKLWKD